MSCNKYFRCPTYEEMQEGMISANMKIAELESELKKLRNQEVREHVPAKCRKCGTNRDCHGICPACE